MNKGLSFSQLLISSVRSWEERICDECILSLALPINDLDPLTQLQIIGEDHKFKFLWDLSPDLSIAAAGECQHLRLSGPRRFPLAQKFTDEIFEQLIDVSVEAPEFALPRVLFSFSFFDHNKSNKNNDNEAFSVHAVLPKWQLSSKGRLAWLRFNQVITQESNVRETIEHLWLMYERLVHQKNRVLGKDPIIYSIGSISQEWKHSYQSSLLKGLNLIRTGDLDKLVLAARQSIHVDTKIDPLSFLSRLRSQHTSSCRFLWETNSNQSFFGASPERLVDLHQGQLRTDALAGTALRNDNGSNLLKSNKDLREHEYVVNSIMKQLRKLGVEPYRNKRPKLIRQGHLIHLHTPIYAFLKSIPPLLIVNALHPTPAVAGLPLREAMNWIKALEMFERGAYAAPIGWIDLNQNADFRVAIRCGYLDGENLDLIAGSGLVKGSTLEGELEEVQLKFDIFLNHFNSQEDFQPNSFSRHSII